MSRTVVRGTPYSKTVLPQYQGSGINTAENTQGTPYHSEQGNSAEFKRVVSADDYGKVMSGSAGNQADPKSNGSGIVLDGAHYANGFSPNAHPTMDSPVPTSAPMFEPGFISQEDAAHLGSGNESGREGIVAGGGVLGRG